MTTITFSFSGKVAGENFSIGNAQPLVDAHLSKKGEILESQMTREEKRGALKNHDRKCNWSTKWETVNGVETPTAILTIEA